MESATRTRDLDGLGAIAEITTLPGDPEWDRATYSFNVLIPQNPAALVRPRSADEAARAVKVIADAGLRIAPQGSAHNTGPLGSLDDAAIVSLEAMKAVELDLGAGTARVEAGARWWDVAPQTSDTGMAVLHGSSPEINVVGYSVGGGMGWLARKHGLQCNRVTAFDVVTADGVLRRADASNEPELFWAMRGGGGNFGLVTAIEFDLVPMPALYAGALFFPFERAPDVLHAYRELVASGVPREFTSIVRTVHMPPLEEIPEVVRSKSFALVEGAFLGSAADGEELIAPLRELGPGMDTFAEGGAGALAELHMDPVEPVPYASTHALLGDFTERAVDATMDVCGPGTGSPVFFEVRHAGGALAEAQPDSGALASLNGEFLAFSLAPVMDPSLAERIEADLLGMAEAFAPDDSGRYLNFTEHLDDIETMFPAGALPRLREVKSAYDPADLFRANHPIEMA